MMVILRFIQGNGRTKMAVISANYRLEIYLFFYFFAYLLLSSQNGQRTSGNLDKPRQLIQFLIYNITRIADSRWLRAVVLIALDVLLNNQAVSS